jgi:enoyl-CoA hydratase
MTTADLVLRADTPTGITTLTLNRPEKANALNPAAFVALRAHLDAIATDESVRCVVLAGAGRSFCAGHDLGSIATGERARSRHFEPETVDALERLPQPTIARLHGHCFTGGLELALACDILVGPDTCERTLPYGLPRDMKERPASSRRRSTSRSADVPTG